MKQKVKKIDNYKANKENLSSKISLLKEYVRENDGKFPDIKEGPLGKWLYTQRRSLKKGELSKERKELLDSLGNWEASYSYEDRWNDKLKQLQEFVNENNRFPVQNEGSIGKWLYGQQKNLKEGKLSNEKKELLDSLGDWINSTYKTEVFEKFKIYRETKNKRIREELILLNIGLVWKAVYDINSNILNQDLFQAGCIGLINAVDRYVPEKGSFSTFAYRYIQGYILNELKKLDKKNDYYSISKVLKEVESEYYESIRDNPYLAYVVVDRLLKYGEISEHNYDETVRKVLLLNADSLEKLIENNSFDTYYNLGYEINDSDLNSIYDKEISNIINRKISLMNDKKNRQLNFTMD